VLRQHEHFAGQILVVAQPKIRHAAAQQELEHHQEGESTAEYEPRGAMALRGWYRERIGLTSCGPRSLRSITLGVPVMAAPGVPSVLSAALVAR
jgi:hypothetical protein